jgi:carbon storage regulator
MLVLTRKRGQELHIGDDITIVINRVSGNRVAIAIDAPKEVPISRGEVQAIRQQFEAAGNCDHASVPASRGVGHGDEVVDVAPRTAR